MSKYELIGTISDTSPSSASTAVGDSIGGLTAFSEIHIEADLVGATGGTLDVYLQRKLADNLWRDWIHFTQIASGGAAVKYSARSQNATGITAVGGGTDASPGVALAASGIIGGHPGATIRAVYVAGTSTSAGAAVTIRVYGRA
jgi:hypothetical protein